MKKLLLLTKTLLAAALLCVGQNAWGAGYTRTLTDGLEVTGYKAKAFYNFQNNTPEVLPTEGDLRYRDGNIWGLHNYAAAGRSAVVTIPVASTDILVIQEYSSSYVTTINRGTENATLSASTGYRVFDITSTADDVTFSVPRYGGIVAAFVMEKDNTVKTGNYTINYKASGETVKTVSGTDIAVGTVIPVLSNFIEGGKKYVTDGGQASSLTIAEGDNNLNITVTEAAQYTCTVNAKAGELLLASPNGSVYSGENVTVYYQKAYSNAGKWYFVDVNGSAPGYGVAFSAVTSNQTQDVTTYTLNNDVVYFAEAEDLTISGSWAANGNYLNWRSNGMSKRMAKKSYIYTSTIAPGVYDVTMWARNNRSAGDGTETLPIFLRDGDGNLTDLEVSFPGWARGGFEAAYTARIAIPDDGKDYSVAINNNTEYTSNLELDYVYLTKLPATVSVTVTAAGYATYVNSDYDLDFSATSIEAYKVKVSSKGVATLTKVDNVPAGTPVLLYKDGGAEEDIPVMTGAAAVTENDLVAGTGAAVATTDGEYTNMILNNVSGIGFYFANGQEVAANRAYLHIATDLAPAATARMAMFFAGSVTGVENVEAAAEAKAKDGKFVEGNQLYIYKKGAKFNAAGQQVK